jgi:hypothetical protein
MNSLNVDSITSKTTNGNLLLSGNGTGNVVVDDSLIVDSITSKTTNGNLLLSGNGAGNVVVDDTLRCDSITSKTTNGAISISPNGGLGTIIIGDGMTINAQIADSVNLGYAVRFANIGCAQLFSDTVKSYTNNTNLVLEGSGTGNVVVDDSLIVDSITSKTTNGNLLLSGNGSGIVQIVDAIKLPTTGGTATNLDYYEEGSFTLTLGGIVPNTNGIVKFVRCGACVNLRMPAIENTSTAAGNISFSGWPSRISPHTGTTIGLPLRVKNAGAIQTSLGWMDWTSSTGGFIYRLPDGTGFGSGATVGITSQILFCTTVP